MQNTKWNLKEKKEKVSSLKIDKDVLSILTSRGITKNEDIINFIQAKIENLTTQKLLTDIDKASNRIISAIKNKEKICIYGDYDVDGITSTSILYLGLKKLGAEFVDFYIPIRDEGYGLNNKALEQIKEEKNDLVITVDCGITSYKEIEFANSIGLEVIITDHHNLLNPVVPNAFAVINPKRIENKYPFRELAGVGTAFMLLIDIFEKFDRKDEAFEYIDLVAIGTIADVVPLISENRIIVKNGLKAFETTKNLGLKMLLKKLFPDKNSDYSAQDVSFGISPVFNAAGRLQDAKLVVFLLISNNELEIKAIIDELIRKNFERKQIQNDIFEMAKKEVEGINDYILVSSSPKYHHGVIGIVAAKLVDAYYKPCIVLEEKEEEGIAVASCRSIANFDITKALQYCSELLEKFGGHTGAAGFTIKIENIKAFTQKINEYAKNILKDEDFCKIINIDKQIPMQKISYEFYKSLELLQPFGFGNPIPLFLTKNVIVDNARLIGEKKNHLSFDISQKGFVNKGAVWFFKPEIISEIKSSVFYDIVYKINMNQYKGKFYTKIIIDDMKESLLKDDKFSFLKSLYETTFPIKSIFYTTYNLDPNKEIVGEFDFERISIFQDNKFVAKLDSNISRLLTQLKKLYNFKFKFKIDSISNSDDFKIVEIIIFKNFDIISFKKNEKNIFNKIKVELISDLDYDSTTKKVLAKLFKDNENKVLISSKNINTAINNNIFLTFSIFNKLKNRGACLILSKDKKLIKDERLMYFCKKKYDSECNYLILDRNTYDKEIDFNNFEKIILLDDNIDKLDGFSSIINKVDIPENVKILNKENIKKYGQENIFVSFLPISDKLNLVNKLNEGEIILADKSIYEIL